MPTPPPEPEPNPLCGADPLARALARLQPAPAGVDGQKLLFLAGQAARDRTVALWRRLFLGQCVLLVAIGCAATIHFVRLSELDRTPQNVTQGVTPAPRPEPTGPQNMSDMGMPPGPENESPESPSAPSPVFTKADAPPDDLADYLRTRREVLTAGLGLLRDTKPQPAAPVNPAELEQRLYLPRGVLTAPYRAPEPKKTPE
jgi:hypothetical protein